MLNQFHLIEQSWEITAVQERAMHVMCDTFQWNQPPKFSLQPVNSPACLIHWRSLMGLLQLLSPEVLEQLKRTFDFPVVPPVEAPVSPVPVVELTPDIGLGRLVFDSHFLWIGFKEHFICQWTRALGTF
ncbi:MAG: hypothetical protein AB2541_07840 [Candidatus Thiodiazotropha sp.]